MRRGAPRAAHRHREIPGSAGLPRTIRLCYGNGPRGRGRTGEDMETLLVILHVIVCLILIMVVLLQSGKAADLAGAFGGGGSQTALGSRGAATFLTKATTASAMIFMLTS